MKFLPTTNYKWFMLYNVSMNIFFLVKFAKCYWVIFFRQFKKPTQKYIVRKASLFTPVSDLFISNLCKIVIRCFVYTVWSFHLVIHSVKRKYYIIIDSVQSFYSFVRWLTLKIYRFISISEIRYSREMT